MLSIDLLLLLLVFFWLFVDLCLHRQSFAPFFFRGCSAMMRTLRAFRFVGRVVEFDWLSADTEFSRFGDPENELVQESGTHS